MESPLGDENYTRYDLPPTSSGAPYFDLSFGRLTRQRESQWVLDRLEDIGTFYYAASITGKNLRVMWELKGNYWDTTSKNYFARAKHEADNPEGES